jgi:hypothetical protein
VLSLWRLRELLANRYLEESRENCIHFAGRGRHTGGLIDWITRDPLCHASMAPRCMQALDSTGGALIVAAYLVTAEGNHG